MKRPLIAGVIAFFSQCAIPIDAIAADVPADFAYALPIAGVGTDALYRIAVPPPVYEGSAFADLRDLRIFNAADEVVPHAFRPLVADSKQPSPVSLPFFALRGARGTRAADLDIALEANNGNVSLRVKSRSQHEGEPDDVLGYLVDLSSQPRTFSSLTLEWDEEPGGYIGTVNVEASRDLKHWSRLVRNAPLLDLTQDGHQLKQSTIALNTAAKKYLRLTWPEESKVVRLKSVFAQPVDESAPLARTSRIVEAVPDPDRQGDYIADLGGRFPVDELTIRLPQDNSVAPLQIFSRDSAGAYSGDTSNASWRPVTRMVAYRLRQDGQIIENPTLHISPRAHRYWLFRVDQQGGGIGAGAIEVQSAWLAHEIIFTARGPGPFRLAYGNSRAQRNALPVQTLVPRWGSESEPKITVAETGSPQTLAGPAAARKRVDGAKVVLWIALFAGVAVLGLMAWRISRQMRSGEADSGPAHEGETDPTRNDSGKE